ncbi:MAG: endolytic transglycosylase MltG [Flavobacteriales bacterium]|nr:endolytic transglycosylase MltG [Flavobacteriales bacterium]
MNSYRKPFFYICFSLPFFLLLQSCHWYGYLYDRNVQIVDGEDPHIEIPTGSTFDDVYRVLKEKKCLKEPEGFKWVAYKKNYAEHIKPGRYKLVEGMTNLELVNLLRSGRQTPVKVSFHYLRRYEQLAGKVSYKIEADSSEIVTAMRNPSWYEPLGMDSLTLALLFIPNTYEFYWNTSGNQFVKRMGEEYQKFWNQERKEKAAKMNLSLAEVGILASIVQSEQLQRKNEWPRIAGLYMNRLEKGMLLQSDPTVVFAHGNFNIKRVLLKHIEIDSPYNTYKYTGLPPGPITLPEPGAIDAVLNYEHHNYYYMCAKDDFSGYHNFAVTLTEHNRNAEKYQKALNRSKIY